MARGKLTAKAVPKASPAVDSAGSAAPEAAVSDIIAAIDALARTQDGLQWEIRVYQIYGAPKNGMKQPFLFNCDAEDLPGLESQLATTYPAGGRFKVEARANGHLQRSIVLDIAPRPGYREPNPFAAPAAIAPAAPPAEGGDRLERVLLHMAEQQRQFMQLIAERLTAPPAAAADPMAMFNNMMGAFKGFQEAVPKVSGETNLKLLMDGIELGKTISGGGADSKTGFDMLSEAFNSDTGKTIAEALVQVLTPRQPQQQQRQPLAQLTPPPIRTANPLAAPVVRPANPPPQPNPRREQMRQGMDWLFNQAQTGADPAIIAEQVAGMLPPDIMEELTVVADPMEWLVSRFPRVEQHRPWFQSLLDNIFEEGDEGEGEPDQGDDDASNSVPKDNQSAS